LRSLLILGALVVVILLLRGFMRADPAKVSRVLRWLGIAIVVGVLLFFAARGYFHWLYVLVVSLLPLLPRIVRLLTLIPVIRQLKAQLDSMRSGGRAASGQTSQVEARFLRMTLDHDTGDMEGEVLAGRFRGRRLSALGLEELLVLLDECRSEDEESAALLEAYLDRVHGDTWQEQPEADDASGSEQAGKATGGPMTRQEAYEILGLEPGASKQKIIEAHRRLMQKLHPDRGGSTYLAAKLNQAKEVLVGR
jgi:DnaJ-domain-containing protein 1